MSEESLALGSFSDGGYADLNLQRLIGGHAVILANAGGGKSYLIRKLLETTHGYIQQVVLDPEDEFYTLRETGNYLIAGGEDGDCPAKPENAKALAMAVLEHNLSVIVQLNDLHVDEQQEFIATFLDTLIGAPKTLWRPMMMVLDEVHRFAPQEGWAASSAAVKDLTARGRKRGLTAILATQRLAKVDKNVTGDVNNWWMGRVGQSTDRRVVADALGFKPTGVEARGLATLAPGDFWAFGPAISPEARLMHVGKVQTTHIQAGQARTATAPPPKALKGILADLAKAAEKPVEASAGDAGPDAPANAAPPAGGPSPEEVAAIRAEGHAEGSKTGFRNGMIAGTRGAIDLLRGVVTKLEAVEADTGGRPDPLFDALIAEAHRLADIPPGVGVREPAGLGATRPEDDAYHPRRRREAFVDTNMSPPTAGGQVSKPVQKVVDSIKHFWPAAVTFDMAGRHAGIGLKSSMLTRHKEELRASGLVECLPDGRYRAFLDAPTGVKPLEAFKAKLPPAYAKILEVIAEAPGWIDRPAIVEKAGVSPTSSTTAAALKVFVDLDLIDYDGKRAKLLEEFR